MSEVSRGSGFDTTKAEEDEIYRWSEDHSYDRPEVCFSHAKELVLRLAVVRATALLAVAQAELAREQTPY